MKKVMVIGSGGREHALGWKLGQSEEVSEVIYAPGNAGTQEEKGRNIPIDGSKKNNFQKLFDFVGSEDIDMVVVGPEAPLADGIIDYFNSRGYTRIFGPTQRASLLETDKFFSFDLMDKLSLPQANSVKCYTTEEAIRAINARTVPDVGFGSYGIVIKARGLTAGKGVTVCDYKEQALEELKKHSEKYGEEVLIAERLFGQEFSVFGISDGNKVRPFEMSAQDHKPLLDGNEGPNTGGMGAYAPAPIAPIEVVRYVADNIMTPVVQEMKKGGVEYKGFIYGGMIKAPKAKVLEFNIRFGDPEAQPEMMMLRSDLYKILSSSLEGKLDEAEMQFNFGASCCVVLASQGYPGNYDKGLVISGLDEASRIPGVKVFHAGTTATKNGLIITSGGRVLGVTGYSPDGIAEAQKLAYEAVSKLSVPGGFHYRKDIADKAR